VNKLEAKPFALIGVNTGHLEAKQLKEVMEWEKLNWRSFVAQETILARWNNPGTPMYYVIDHRGVIRYKWSGYPGEKAIDTALEKMINEAEGEQAPPKFR
jgi:hypothetical protein